MAKNKFHYDWVTIQHDYDSGLSQRDIIQKYKMSTKTIWLAVKEGRLQSRKPDVALTLKLAVSPRSHSIESKEKLKTAIEKRYAAGWKPKAGRCKKYNHMSPIAGNVLVDGTWELKVAQYFDAQGYTWNRNTKRFPYINLNNKPSYYTPDFWVKELGGYVEVKGYETDLDRCKWKQFSLPLLVWKLKELQDLKIL